MKKVIHLKYQPLEKELTTIINEFTTSGNLFGKKARNTIKLFNLKKETINVKSFKNPNFFNKIIYRFFRKSKAQRSFEYANKLTSLNIGTPQPIAFYENKEVFFFKESYYISEHLTYDLTYRDLITNLNYPDRETILRQFTQFTFKLHENDILFLDHSPGNTLIKKNGKNYDFFLVDLNRMQFKKLTFNERMMNFSKLTPDKKMIAIMSHEYAKLIKKDATKIFNRIWQLTTKFQEKYYRKKRLKQKYLGRK